MKFQTLIILIIVSFLGCKSAPNTSASFQSILDKAVKKRSNQLSGVSMTVLAPKLNILWTGASGYDSKKKLNKLSAEQPFRIASVTKTFVATAILLLQEEEKLNLENAIAPYLSEEHLQLLTADGYDPSAITIKQFLQHRSGREYILYR